jgi:acyl-CoA thioesterase
VAGTVRRMQTDAEFLGLTPVPPAAGPERPGGEGRHRFTVVERLARMDGRLYGGTAIAVSIATAELVSQRPALWMTTQFVSTVDRDSVVEVHTEVLAAGRRTQQVRVTATAPSGEVVFASLGATGHHRPDGIAGQFERCPTVTSPHEADEGWNPFARLAASAGLGDVAGPPRSGFGLAIEMREAVVEDHPDPGPGRVCMWVRRHDRVPITAAVAAYIADMVPLGVAYALDSFVGGTSIDNTIRIGAFPPVEEATTEWLLLDLRPHLAAGGYGHGEVHVWTEDGRLVATASQTASMFAFDVARLRGIASA